MPAENSPGFIQKLIRSFLKIFFNLLYHQFAWTYDWVADFVSLGRWKTWVYSPVPYLADSKVLELGCGPGYLQLALRNKEISSFGIDASKQMVHIAANRLSRHSQPVNIVQGISQNLPFPPSSFDRLVATFPSEFISDPETLTQAWRVLNDSGELIILSVAWITGKSWWDRAAAWIFRVTLQAPIDDPLELDANEVFPLSILQDVGFQVKSEVFELRSSKLFLIHAVKVSPENH